MGLLVQKFGGTSVGDTDRIGQVADKVARFRAEGHDLAARQPEAAGQLDLDLLVDHGVSDVC